jgi:hypothetical protein
MRGDLFNKDFAYFGQGTPFDNTIDSNTHQPRRPDNERIHMINTLHYGYPRWYVFCRSAVIANEDAKFWLNLSKLVALAYELHMTLNPTQSVNREDSINKEHPEMVQQLKTKLTNTTFD